MADETLQPPTPIWRNLPERFHEALSDAAGRLDDELPGAGVEVDPYRMLHVLLDLEIDALELARTAMRDDGLIPSTRGGRVIWFDLSADLGRFLRQRLGLPESSGAPRRP